MRTALTIAGSDSSGGAGIQADIKTIISNGVYAMSAITALTAQNTTGVTGIMEATPEFLADQLDNIFTDIYPDAVKIGMVSSSALIETIAKKLRQYEAKNIVVDPVMVATSGAKLINDEAIEALKSQLLPMATVLTPNIPEAEVLSGMKIETADDMIKAAAAIGEKYSCAVLCKGGHQLNDANDLLWREAITNGSRESGSTIQTLTEQDVRYPVPLLLIWQRDLTWILPWRGQRNIFPEHLLLCWILEKAWITVCNMSSSNNEITAEASVSTNGESGVSSKLSHDEITAVKLTPDKEAK